MSLFLINRYKGDDEIDEQKKKNQASLILEKLNSSAKKKKISLLSPSSNTKSPKHDKSETENGNLSLKDNDLQDLKSSKSPKVSDKSPSSVKKRKRKLRNDEDSDTNLDSNREPVPKKRKKDSKLNSSHEENDDDRVVKKKKKSKLKSDLISDIDNESFDIESSKGDMEKSSEGVVGKFSKGTEQESRIKSKKKKSKENRKSVGADLKEELRTVVDSDKNTVDVDDLDKNDTNDEHSDNDEEEVDEDDDEMTSAADAQRSLNPPEADTAEESFTVLGQVREKHLQKLKYKLPEWLAHPVVMVSNLRKGGVALDDVTYLEEELKSALKEDGVEKLFPVQQHLVPSILKWCQPSFSTGLMGFRPRDICCSSPTGSGKTLAFALPIVQALKCRLVRRIRALVILPTRDLAKQVHKVFARLSRKTQLKIGLAVGQKTLAHEQSQIVKKNDVDDEFVSLIDILIVTPGRLVDHIQNTDGFDLSHLRFIVIDEADRVLDEIKQDWVHHVTESFDRLHGGKIFSQPLTINNLSQHRIPPQKLLFSATLTQNPEKLQQLNLFHPQLYTSLVQSDSSLTASVPERVEGDFIGKYTTPAGLTEYYIECTPQQRPLLVLHYLHNLKFKQVLCFTNSVESTHRLASLMTLFDGGINVCQYSSKMDHAERKKIINKFKSGDIHMIVCSDAMARGMDIENVKYVISYELPPKIKTYIHRVGRTARAGRAGTAISLLEKKEIFSFKKMVRSSGKTDVKEEKVRPSSFKNLLPPYKEALEQLPKILRLEKHKKSSSKR